MGEVRKVKMKAGAYNRQIYRWLCNFKFNLRFIRPGADLEFKLHYQGETRLASQPLV